MALSLDFDDEEMLDLDELLSNLPKLLQSGNTYDENALPILYWQKDTERQTVCSMKSTVFVDGTLTSEKSMYGSSSTRYSERGTANCKRKDCYPMEYSGFGLVINNKTFETASKREGTEVDGKDITELLKYPSTSTSLGLCMRILLQIKWKFVSGKQPIKIIKIRVP